jgi:hypothetical protein
MTAKQRVDEELELRGRTFAKTGNEQLRRRAASSKDAAR